MNRFFSVLLLIILGGSSVPALAQQSVSVVMTNSRDHYLNAVTGFWEALESQGILQENLTVKTYDMSADDPQSVIQQLKAENPDLTFTLGTGATRYVRNALPLMPLIFAVVIFPERNGLVEDMEQPGAPVSGVTLDVSVRDQLQAMKQLRPNLKRIGVIYNPTENQTFIQKAEKVATEEGLTLIKREIEDANQLSGAFESLKDKIQMLWMIPDNTVFPRDRNKLAFSRNYLIKNSTLNKIPTYGLAENFVKAGATLSLTADIDDAGKQAGSLAAQVLKGSELPLPVQYPQTVKLSLNLRAAEAIGLDVPDPFIKKAIVVEK